MVSKLEACDSENELQFTGERFVPGLGGEIEAEHLHRYAAIAEIVSGKDVLDIASGEGYGSARLALTARHVVGVDIDADSIKHAQKRYGISNLEYRLGSCQQIPVDDRSIDIVVSFETLEHIPEIEQKEFLLEIKRVLRVGGFAIISTPDKRVYSDGRNYQNPFHLKEFYADEFVRFLKQKFSYVRIARQHVMTGSFILIQDSNSPITVLQKSAQKVNPIGAFDSATYMIAVVGNSDNLPDLSQSLLAIENKEIFGEYQQHVKELTNEVHMLKGFVEDQDIGDDQNLQALLRERDALQAAVERAEQGCAYARQQKIELDKRILAYERKERALTAHMAELTRHWEKRLEELSSEASIQQHKKRAFRAELEEHRAEIDEQKQRIAALQAEIEKYEAHVQKQDSFIEQLTRSLSWRITAPLRALRRKL